MLLEPVAGPEEEEEEEETAVLVILPLPPADSIALAEDTLPLLLLEVLDVGDNLGKKDEFKR